MHDVSETLRRQEINGLRHQFEEQLFKLVDERTELRAELDTFVATLEACLDLLENADSGFMPLSNSDREWTQDRDAICENARKDIADWFKRRPNE